MLLPALAERPTLELRIAAATPLGDLERTRSVLDAFEGADTLRPEVVLGAVQGKFEAARLSKRLHSMKGFLSIVLRRRSPDVEYNVMFNTSGTMFVRGVFLLEDFAETPRCEELGSLVRSIAEATDVSFARAHDEADAELADKPRGSPLLVPNEIDDIFWMTLWGRALVERAGRDRVLTIPSYRTEALRDGAVLVLTRATPVDALGPEARRAQARALVHLRPERNEEEVVASLMDRSRALAPAPGDLDPGIAAVLELIIADAAKANRERERERMGAIRPPPVAEVLAEPRPAQGASNAAAETYDEHAENLIALLQPHIPEIESFDPGIVPRIDYWLWRLKLAEDADREDVENDLAPALGGYIALLMVNKLGGTLVPRRKLDESQVVVGGRAFLPFLRARHALASRDAQLTHSMTQFVSAARETD